MASELVSAIMPTRGREAFARRAVEYFEAQTHKERELIILDDDDDPSFPHGIQRPGIRYASLAKRYTIGKKRNIACALARGRAICVWDDDDWSAPGRIADQLARLQSTGAPVTGYHSMRFWHRATGQCWQYRGSAGIALGTSLCFRWLWWHDNRFEDRQIGEDVAFSDTAARAGLLVSVDSRGLMVSVVHDAHTSTRENIGRNTDAWRPCDPPRELCNLENYGTL